MPRLILSWLLALLLLLSEQGAVLHTIGHLSSRASATETTLSADDGDAERGTCTICQAFAQLANPVASYITHFRVPAAAYAVSPHRCCAIIGADTPNPRSRGPPHA